MIRNANLTGIAALPGDPGLLVIGPFQPNTVIESCQVSLWTPSAGVPTNGLVALSMSFTAPVLPGECQNGQFLFRSSESILGVPALMVRENDVLWMPLKLKVRNLSYLCVLAQGTIDVLNLSVHVEVDRWEYI